MIGIELKSRLRAALSLFSDFRVWHFSDVPGATLDVSSCSQSGRRCCSPVERYKRAATMNYNASAATSWFKRTSSHAGLLFVNQIGSTLRVGMQRNGPFASSC
jgi:hypothetical protein